MARTTATGFLLAIALGIALWVWPNPPAPVEASPDSIDVTALIEHEPTEVTGRDPDVPDLPFPDNPNPELCGIPEPWRASNDTAWLTGMWQGELVQSEVLLYDSHLRLSIAASASHGSEVRVLMSQINPTLDFYFVEIVGGGKGWIPAPFLSFEPVEA